MADEPVYDRPGVYEIRVKGHLDEQWSVWFDGLTLAQCPDDVTCMTGVVADQAALHGLLCKIRDIGLPLLSLNRTGEKIT
ncbi:MAG: hypothetical protein JXB47_00450 [Anaerolineae bacterium]|nr:hypothetical protein [Anaerolineae bacterium]